MSNILVSVDDRPRTRWVNGGGYTTELVSYEDSTTLTSGRGGWRLSVAELSTTGEFSSLPGVRRMFCPVGGAVTLAVGDEVFHIADREVFEFDGTADTQLHHLERPCFAVNVMVRAKSAPLRVTHVPNEGSFVGVALTGSDGYRQFDVFAPDTDAPRDALYLGAAPRVATM